jgi:hypothetical protein
MSHQHNKRPAPEPLDRKLRAAVVTLTDELISAEFRLAVLRERLTLAESLLADAGQLIAPHPCSFRGCERDALVRLHSTHHVCLAHMADLNNGLGPTQHAFPCPACKELVSTPAEVLSAAKRRSRFNPDVLEDECPDEPNKPARWRSHARHALLGQLGLDTSDLGYDSDYALLAYADCKRLCRRLDPERPGRPVVDFDWNGADEEPAPAGDQCASQCAQNPDL